MNLLEALLLGLLLGLFMAISVGPTLFAVIKYSISYSYKAGIAFVVGVSVSDIIYVTLANMAAPWLKMIHQYATILLYTAAVVLTVAGGYGLFKKYKPRKPSPRAVSINKKEYFKIFSSGFLINTLNPALILQWVGAATITAAQSTAYRFVLFASCLSLVLGIDILKVLLANTLRKKLTLRNIMYVQKFSSLCLLGFGVAIFIMTYFKIGNLSGDASNNPLQKYKMEQTK